MKKFFLGIILIAAVAAAGWKYLPQDFTAKSAAWAGSVLGSAKSILQNKISPPDYSGKKDAQTLIRDLKNNLEEMQKQGGPKTLDLAKSSENLLDQLAENVPAANEGLTAKILEAVFPSQKRSAVCAPEGGKTK